MVPANKSHSIDSLLIMQPPFQHSGTTFVGQGWRKSSRRRLRCADPELSPQELHFYPYSDARLFDCLSPIFDSIDKRGKSLAPYIWYCSVFSAFHAACTAFIVVPLTSATFSSWTTETPSPRVQGYRAEPCGCCGLAFDAPRKQYLRFYC